MVTPVSSPLRTVPIAPRYPVLGVLPSLWQDPLSYFLRTARHFGPIVRIDLASRPAYLVSHPECVRHILQEHSNNYRKGYDQAKPLMGEGLVTSEGEFWRKQRRLIQPTFSKPNIALYSRTMMDETEAMLNRWEESSRSGAVFNIASEMTRLTQRIIVKTMFSSDVGEQVDRLGLAFDQALEHLNSILFSPSPLLQRLPTPANRRHQQALAYLDDYVFGLIAERRRSGEDQGDFLSRLVLAVDADTGEQMPDQQVRDELMTIFLAGHETTANALAWTWYLLGMNPAVELRLMDEIRTHLGDRPPVYDDLENLLYSGMVFSEALRMYPPAWLFVRHAIEEDQILDYKIPAGAMMMLSPYVTHHLPEFWPEPEKFEPDRFAPDAASQRVKYSYFPFGGGPRLCIGYFFAQVEAQLILTRVLQRYVVRLAPGAVVRAAPIASLQPKPGVMVTIANRAV